MKVDLRTFPKLMNEIVPLIHQKSHNLLAPEVQEMLNIRFQMPTVVVHPSDTLYWVEMDEETYMWAALRWK